MNKQLIQPRKALNKAFLKTKPNRNEIEVFKTNLIQVLDSCNDKELEEFHKNLVSDFLKNTYYSPNHFINTKNRNDLVIHNGKDAKTTVGVIIEAKSPTNKSEMISVQNLNGKALQELVLYFLRERITHKNLEIKHLVVTNIYEWFVFDAQLFEKHFAQNKTFVKQFEEFEAKQLSGVKTDFFYKDIAKPHIETLKNEIEYTYFNFKDYDKALRNADKDDDKSLIALFKLLSPEHLLKLSFANDSNSLDKNFYSELLHIIGLTETKEGGKKLIERHKAANRNNGSLLENAIIQLDTLDKISRLQNPKQYGDTYEERLFNVALELTITWVNRILFLKLLEAQLISYHKGDRSYAFLNAGTIHDYDKLNKLFFQVLAKKPSERNNDVFHLYAKVPYLNSSLFEPTDLEHETLFISNLEDEIPLPLLSSTVIKDGQGKKEKGTKNALNYFFSFLDAYDFASEGSEDIQEDNKTLINASVLGLIFEKINGYKDGSFFTPGFITMYMCKETIRRAVVQKFNETKNWNCETIIDVHNKITDTKEANAIVNTIKICDPAVGSGHFLVSALNELIVIKHDLGILQDATGKKLRDYSVEIVNDELIVADDEGIPFTYNPANKESQRIQETLFKEKETIIENCLFGVDINPNSVKICRLRLWIELLKNAFYTEDNQLETLPNIDINIKCGNSLISRFDLNTDLKKALKQSKWNIESYKLAVATYRNAESKEQKREMERLIGDIKGNFRSEIAVNDPKKLKLEKQRGELFNYTQQVGLFERSKKEQTEWNKKVNTLAADIKTLETEIEEIKSNKIYENAFEWRFEFPEVLNDDGDFVGFDVVIGNPPYLDMREIGEVEISLYKKEYKTASNRVNLFPLFIELSNKISNYKGINSMIIPRNLIRSNEYELTRSYILEKYNIDNLLSFKIGVFEDVTSEVVVLILNKSKNEDHEIEVFNFDKTIDRNIKANKIFQQIFNDSLGKRFNIYLNDDKVNVLNKMKLETILMQNISETLQGIIAGDEKKLITNKLLNEDFKPIVRGKDLKKYCLDKIELEFIDYSNDGKLLTRARKKKNFEVSKKILTQHVSSKIVAVIDFDSKYYMQTINGTIITNKDISYEFILGLLNSKLMNFFYDYSFNLGAEFTTAVAIENLNLLPIKFNEKIDQQPFIDKVDQILALKKANPQADTSALEREIDLMVYELYGLTQEEIEIVENS
jgi:adenine-specific DNA-methyltransferase